MFGFKESGKREINLAEFICMTVIVMLCFVVGILEVDIEIILDLNGAVLGFCFIYLLPSLLHIKCAYFPKGKMMLKEEPKHEVLNEERASKPSSNEDHRHE